MTFEPALTQELKTITSLGNRVYPLASTEANSANGVPYLIYASSEGIRTKSMDGYGSSKTVRAEINIVTKRYAELKFIAAEAIDLLVGMEGRVIGTDGPKIQELTYERPVELYEEQPKLYRCVIEFEVYF